MSVHTVAAADTSFLLREHGEGPGVPVLLLHGVPETSSCWARLAPRLALGRRVLAPDLPGLGGSTYGGPYDVPSLVTQLVALLEARTDGGPVDVVGHDWGGSLALALAGARPDLVRRLVVVNAPYRSVPARAVHIPLFALPVAPELLFRVGGRRVVRLLLGLGWRSSTPLDPETQAEYEAAYSHADAVHAMLGYYRAATRPRLAAMLRRQKPEGAPRVRAEKMLVLWGASDPVLPISTGEAVVRDLGPECVMVTVPGAGHFVVEEAPEVVAEVLTDFLSGESVRAAPPEGPEVHRVPERFPPAGPAAEVRTVGGVPVGATPAQKSDEPAAQSKPAEAAGKTPATRPAGAARAAKPAGKAPAAKPAGKASTAKPAGKAAAAKPAGKATAAKPAGKKAATTPAEKKAATKPAERKPAEKKAARTAPTTSTPAGTSGGGASAAPRKGPAGAQQPGSPAARRRPRGAGPEVPPSPGTG